MVDPNNIINYNRTDEELEELILFLIAVAGKNAATTARQLDAFLQGAGSTPFNKVKLYDRPGVHGQFAYHRHNPIRYDNFGIIDPAVAVRYEVRQYNDLPSALKAYGFGCQTRLARAFREVTNSGINLRGCSMAQLMAIHGIGRKSASCFLAWTRKYVRVAMLDVHLMKFIRDDLGHDEAPKNTPSSRKQYDHYEKIYLDHCDKIGVNPTEYDLMIWKHYANARKVN
jgi:hypothetical protein